MAKQTPEEKAAAKARKQALRAIAAQASVLWIMGGADSATLTALATQLIVVAASGEINAKDAAKVAEVCDDISSRMREIAERGDSEPGA